LDRFSFAFPPRQLGALRDLPFFFHSNVWNYTPSFFTPFCLLVSSFFFFRSAGLIVFFLEKKKTCFRFVSLPERPPVPDFSSSYSRSNITLLPPFARPVIVRQGFSEETASFFLLLDLSFGSSMLVPHRPADFFLFSHRPEARASPNRGPAFFLLGELCPLGSSSPFFQPLPLFGLGLKRDTLILFLFSPLLRASISLSPPSLRRPPPYGDGVILFTRWARPPFPPQQTPSFSSV